MTGGGTSPDGLLAVAVCAIIAWWPYSNSALLFYGYPCDALTVLHFAHLRGERVKGRGAAACNTNASCSYIEVSRAKGMTEVRHDCTCDNPAGSRTLFTQYRVVKGAAYLGDLLTRLRQGSAGAIRTTLTREPDAPSLLRARPGTGVPCFRCAVCTYGNLSSDPIILSEARLVWRRPARFSAVIVSYARDGHHVLALNVGYICRHFRRLLAGRRVMGRVLPFTAYLSCLVRMTALHVSWNGEGLGLQHVRRTKTRLFIAGFDVRRRRGVASGVEQLQIEMDGDGNYSRALGRTGSSANLQNWPIPRRRWSTVGFLYSQPIAFISVYVLPSIIVNQPTFRRSFVGAEGSAGACGLERVGEGPLAELQPRLL
ncbi:hypothetical protein PR048_016889 [Dryococelus australis]|uniref:Uncharacterized protein n=1 Tax=Dryococelus australis TaxID=614101 RepID=A0ABQ9H875_9NEOP|nr:hypothetical protein PR048_016889 [Dryococelus australis]